VGGVAAQFFTNTGAVLTGGKLYTYAAGTTTPAVTFTSSQGVTAWTNPIVLDAAGRVSGSGEIWLTDGINYKFVLKDSNDVLIATYDNISGINSNFISFTNSQQIITATANQTVFNLSITYQVGTNSLSVFVDGVNQYGPGAQYAYTETDSDTVTFVSGLHVGAQVKFTTSQQQGAGAVNASQVTYDPAGAGAVATNVQAKLREYVSIIDYGADPTGVALCNTALDAAKAVCNTVYFPPGTYRIENYNLQDLRIVGAGGDGPNYGTFTTIIEGSGDIFVDANNFSMSNLAIRNTASGTLGKLIQVKDIDTGIGPIISCQFLRAAYHIYHQSALYTIVGATIQQCLFREATIYSRYYANQGLFQYSEFDCYTAANKRGLFIQSTSACLIAASVFEFNDEGAVYVQNTTVFSDVIRGLKFQSIHFEQNGNVTPSADVTVLVTLSKARVEFDNCGFYSSTVPGNVNLLGSTNVLIFDHNCTNISYNNGGGGKITQVNPTAVGELNAIKVIDRDIQALGGVFIGNRGFLAGNGIYTQISSTATPTSIAVPTTNGTLLIVVRDATTEGGALLLLTTTTVNVVSSSLTSITFSIAAGFLNGRTTGGASSRDLYFNYMGT
jgi:hypothetical protein